MIYDLKTFIIHAHTEMNAVLPGTVLYCSYVRPILLQISAMGKAGLLLGKVIRGYTKALLLYIRTLTISFQLLTLTNVDSLTMSLLNHINM